MTIDGFTIDDFAAAEVVDGSISCSRFSIFNLTDARCLLEVDGAEPVLDERAAARAVGIVDPWHVAQRIHPLKLRRRETSWQGFFILRFPVDAAPRR